MASPPPQQRPGSANKSSNASASEVELTNVQNGHVEPSLPLEEDIMQCARIGALKHIQEMYKSGKYDAAYKDAEGITPLHWAAINNQYGVCKWLVEQGVDVNAKGGESNATPAMWAAQKCHYYTVNLLLQHGTDPLLVDGQGYNILHLATIDGSLLLLILLLHQNIPVDTPDPQGHTSLMWAAYKGWAPCVDVLLRWGASVNATDDSGFTPLHWALVKGSKPCLDKILEFGADRFAKTNDGKTPAICAQEMNSVRAWHRALQDQGFNADGTSRSLPLNLASILRNRAIMSKFFFLYPFVMIYVGLYIISGMPIFVGIPFAVIITFAMQWVAQQIANQGPHEYQSIHKTPFLAGVFAGTLFWVGVRYLFYILPVTFTGYPISNILFALSFGSTSYFYYTAMTEDPGYVPKHASRNLQRAVIDELFSLWKFDEDSFCVQCMIRKPLRSKHCRRCNRCVAKQDHHCPWINNCVANNNLRHFFIYILSMEVGILFFVRLVVAYFEALPVPADPQCNILSAALCSIVLRDPFTVALTFWTCLQLIWITMLVIVQTVQISKNVTTFENMQKHSSFDDHGHGHAHTPGHRHGRLPHGAQTHTTDLNDTAAATSRLHPMPRKPDGFLTRWKKLLGLDAFMATASDGLADAANVAGTGHGGAGGRGGAGGFGRRNRNGNPFSHGIVGNCRDFWCDPAPIFGQRHTGEGFLGGEVVDYHHLYETPLRTRTTRRSGPGRGMWYTRVENEDEAVEPHGDAQV